VLGWGLTTPALWLDESATVLATRRGWPGLGHLLRGPEAPLLPYYAVEKVAVAGTEAVLPAGAVPPELLYRLPSVAAAVLAVWVLAAWLSRLGGRGIALAATGVLLVLPTFSRYGQETRPYAFTLAAGVVATVAWSRLVLLDPPQHSPGEAAASAGSAGSAGSGRVTRRPLVLALAGYAAAVTALGLSQVLAATLVAAHLALAAAAPGLIGRRRALRRTVAGAAAGLLPVLPFAVATWAYGKGPKAATPAGAAEVVFRLLAEPQTPVAGAAVLLAAALGATRVRSARHGAVARIALAWALVPPLLVLPVALVRPTLLTTRYLVFTVPGWAILAGLGLLTAAEQARRAVRARRLSWDGALVTGAVVATALVAAAALQWHGLTAVRGSAGHGEDIRPALAAAGAEGRLGLPLVVHSRSVAEVVPYAPDIESRLLGARLQETDHAIWPVKESPATLDARLRDHPQVVLLIPGSLGGDCGWHAHRSTAWVTRYVTRCMPAALRDQGYRVVHAEATGRRWTMALLSRPEPPAAAIPGT
jgi:mannosyltransferase